MKKIVIISVVVVFTAAAVFGVAKRGNGSKPVSSVKHYSQYNICILLDLSDRIDPRQDPLQAGKDKKIIAATVDQFCEVVKRKLYVNSSDILRVAVAPQPNDYRKTLFDISDNLSIDMRKLKVSEKREKLPLLKERLSTQVSTLYDAAVKNSKFQGSDIWSFFRDNLESYRIEASDGKQVRNVLVVLSDGYISFDSSKNRPREGRRTSWMEVAKMRRGDWLRKLNSDEFGLIPAGKDHRGWEVLVLEVDPKTPEDLPVIQKYWTKWLNDMEIVHFRLEKENDSSTLITDVIADFLN